MASATTTDDQLAAKIAAPKLVIVDGNQVERATGKDDVALDTHIAARKARRRGPFFATTRAILPGAVGPLASGEDV